MDKNANIEAEDRDERTALMFESPNSHINVVKYLIYKNANIEDNDKDEKTSLILASRYGHHDVVKYLMHYANLRQ